MWIGRDNIGYLWMFYSKPERTENTWQGSHPTMLWDETLFPNLKWEDEPLEVSLYISNTKDSWRYYQGDDSFMGK